MSSVLRLATRSSPLARRQTDLVSERLAALDPDLAIEVVTVETLGDQRSDVPISEISGRGVFTTEVDEAVLQHRADLAVHSAKDLPSATEVPGLRIVAVPDRAEVRDVLVGCNLDGLAPGGVVATGAPRRRVQLSYLRPDLVFTELRGNIGTRLERVPPGGSIVMALAALQRLGLEQHVAEVLSISTMLPQVGQGAIALRGREDDDATAEYATAIDDLAMHRAVRAERAFLSRLGGGCEAPVGAYAHVTADGHISIEAMIASLDGHVVLRRRLDGADAEALGRELAETMLTKDGADALVDLQ